MSEVKNRKLIVQLANQNLFCIDGVAYNAIC